MIAVLDDPSDAITQLRAAGYDLEVMRGAEGMKHLDPGGETGGAGSTIRRLLSAFGDQYRVIERLRDELDCGRQVVSVSASPDEGGEAVRILQDHGGEYIWKLGKWTYTEVGD